jgi:hypothetical protein
MHTWRREWMCIYIIKRAIFFVRVRACSVSNESQARISSGARPWCWCWCMSLVARTPALMPLLTTRHIYIYTCRRRSCCGPILPYQWIIISPIPLIQQSSDQHNYLAIRHANSYTPLNAGPHILLQNVCLKVRAMGQTHSPIFIATVFCLFSFLFFFRF